MKRLGNLFRRDPTNGKEDAELAYWRKRRAEQGPLEQGAPLYRTIFVDHRTSSTGTSSTASPAPGS